MIQYPSFDIVIETDNLAYVDMDALYECLDSIGAQGDALAQADGVYLADNGTVPAEILDGLRARYPWIRLVRTPDDASYIELKLAGSMQSQSEIIVFCDGDVQYAPGWLDGLLTAFVERPVPIPWLLR